MDRQRIGNPLGGAIAEAVVAAQRIAIADNQVAGMSLLDGVQQFAVMVAQVDR